MNLENDLIGKYVEKLMQPGNIRNGLTLDFLQQTDFESIENRNK